MERVRADQGGYGAAAEKANEQATTADPRLEQHSCGDVPASAMRLRKASVRCCPLIRNSQQT
jgi:hypothetical protein